MTIRQVSVRVFGKLLSARLHELLVRGEPPIINGLTSRLLDGPLDHVDHLFIDVLHEGHHVPYFGAGEGW